jgi:predicted O-methyltransferase YrrM
MQIKTMCQFHVIQARMANAYTHKIARVDIRKKNTYLLLGSVQTATFPMKIIVEVPQKSGYSTVWILNVSSASRGFHRVPTTRRVTRN